MTRSRVPVFPPAERLALPGRDVSLSVHEVGEGPAVVFCHGFPELAFSWRHQLPAVAAAGFRAIAPDQRGYGASDCPDDIESYDLDNLTADLVALLDAKGIERAVFVGHDWGGFVAWAMPVLHPERCAGIIGICTPYVAMPPTAEIRNTLGIPDERLYVLWFQSPGVAEGVLDRKPRQLFEVMMREPLPPEQAAARMFEGGQLDMNPFRRLDEIESTTDLIVSDAELDEYASGFERSGFRGGINWYRNIDRNAQRHPEIGVQPLDLPCLMITAEWDAALRPELAAGMDERCSDLETVMVPRGGHWVQQEQPEIVNEILCEWLGRRYG